MRRATTPTHTFTFPKDIEVAEVTEASIIYSQCGKKILEKTLSDLGIDAENNLLALRLTETETNLFAPGKALIQVRVKTNGTSLASQMLWLNVKPVLDSKEM